MLQSYGKSYTKGYFNFGSGYNDYEFLHAGKYLCTMPVGEDRMKKEG